MVESNRGKLKLYNTLTRKKEVFKPIKGKNARMYACGPTVYNYVHIGNLRTYVFNDILKKSLEFLGYNVKHVMNITDVEDKIIRELLNKKGDLKSFTKKYETAFFIDMASLNNSKPETLRATENISKMIDLIQRLLKKRYAYKAKGGIYFSIIKSKGYGKLAQIKKIKLTKQRVLSDEYDKENAKDFVLWKFYNKKDGKVFWNTPLGKGRPGWHIECSVMSMKKLGESFDIHTGGIDLIFPHHTNEIAQSEALTGKKFVSYWLHPSFLTMKKGKMSKSVGNILTLKEITEKGFNPLDFRYLCLTTHYRKPLNFSLELLKSAGISYKRLKNLISEIKDDKKTNKKYLQEFENAINDDLNMPKALQVLWNLVRDKKAQGKIKTIKEMDKVFSLDLLKKEKTIVLKEVQKLAKDREKARKKKDWKTADKLRDKINSLSYVVEDTPKGTKISKSKLR